MKTPGSVAVIITVEKDGTKAFDVMPSAVIVNHLSEDLVLTYDQTEALEIHVQGAEGDIEFPEPGAEGKSSI